MDPRLCQTSKINVKKVDPRVDTVTVTVQGAGSQKKTVTQNIGEKLIEKRWKNREKRSLDENVARRIIWRRRRRNHCWRSSGLRLSSSHHHQFL